MPIQLKQAMNIVLEYFMPVFEAKLPPEKADEAGGLLIYFLHNLDTEGMKGSTFINLVNSEADRIWISLL